MSFTDTEIAFLAHHGYGPDDVYDGRNQAKVTWVAGAKAAGKDIVLATPCTKPARHRLKTRAGHCFQCDPKKIAFVRRETVTGYVYIAGSLKGRLIKIGMSEGSPSTREYKINYDRYGGVDDWVILYTVKVNNAGRIERVARESLRGHRVFGVEYTKDGSSQGANELLRCSYSKALAAVTSAVGARVFGTVVQIATTNMNLIELHLSQLQTVLRFQRLRFGRFVRPEPRLSRRAPEQKLSPAAARRHLGLGRRPLLGGSNSGNAGLRGAGAG